MGVLLRLAAASAISLALLGTGAARAAAINCGKAAAGTERLICEDPDLSSLDSQLAAAFAGALDRSLHPADVRQGQIVWLKTRDACASNTGCMITAYKKRIQALSNLSDEPAICAGSTTPEIESCAAEYSKRADRELARYLAAARKRLADDAKDFPGSAGPKQALTQLDAAQTAWIAYRKAECEAVYSWFSDGTIRGTEFQGCWREVTKARSAAILSTWLQFMDRTPPLMPPPSPK